jgi:hypothetical protein
MKKIIFYANTEQVYNDEDPPVPASEKIPNWYKQLNLRVDNFPERGRPSSTVKACRPVLDALTTGYMICAPQDLIVFESDNEKYIQWRAERDYKVVEKEDIDRMDGFFVPKDYLQQAWRISTYSTIETPIGSSVLVTHPFNRYDLPFLTVSGVVDTDSLQMPLAITILLKKDFSGVIEKGTPLAQVFPFIRQDWDHEIKSPINSLRANKIKFKLISTAYNSYVKNFWQKKLYK